MFNINIKFQKKSDCRMLNLSRTLVSVGRRAITQQSVALSSSVVNKSAASSALKPEERVTATMIPGDGVGPELMASVEEVFKAAGVPMDFEVYFMSEVRNERVVIFSSKFNWISEIDVVNRGCYLPTKYSSPK